MDDEYIEPVDEVSDDEVDENGNLVGFVTYEGETVQLDDEEFVPEEDSFMEDDSFFSTPEKSSQSSRKRNDSILSIESDKTVVLDEAELENFYKQF